MSSVLFVGVSQTNAGEFIPQFQYYGPQVSTPLYPNYWPDYDFNAGRPSTLYKPTLTQVDFGWVAQVNGVTGIGSTPSDAMLAFDEAWTHADGLVNHTEYKLPCELEDAMRDGLTGQRLGCVVDAVCDSGHIRSADDLGPNVKSRKREVLTNVPLSQGMDAKLHPKHCYSRMPRDEIS